LSLRTVSSRRSVVNGCGYHLFQGLGAEFVAATTSFIDKHNPSLVNANHRYMVDRTTRDLMVTRGWLAEGDGPDLVVMCSPL
jgi:hypothetical protein